MEKGLADGHHHMIEHNAVHDIVSLSCLYLDLNHDEPAIPVFFLDEEMRTLFRKTRNLLDRILETFDILEDQDLMEKIREGEEDIKKGRIMTLEDYKSGKRFRTDQ